jgi:hypothetical protein
MAVTIYGELTAPNVTLSLVDGGSLTPSTTYYIRVIAGTTADTRYRWRGSVPSTEQTITTGSASLSIKVDWSVPTDATRFWIFISTTSGDYVGTKCLSDYYTGKSGTTFTITGSETKYSNSTMPISYSALPFGFNRERGRIEVTFTGTTTLADIASALATAGYTDSYYWDAASSTFVMHGGFYHTGSTTSALTQYNGLIGLVLGNWGCENANMTITLGQYSAINYLGYNGCVLKFFLGGGPEFANFVSGKIYLYGCYVIAVPGAYYTQRTTTYWDGAVADGNSIFQYFGSVSDFYSKMTAQCDLNGGTLTRVTQAGPFIIGYYASVGENLRDCISTKSMSYGAYHDFYIACATSGSNRPIKIYDHTLKHKASIDNAIIAGQQANSTPLSFYFSLSLTVVDTRGMGISGANVNIINDIGDERYTLITSISGSITKTDLLYKYCTNVGATLPYYAYTQTNHYPHTVTISKPGYQTKTVKYTMDRKREEIETLEYANISTDQEGAL